MMAGSPAAKSSRRKANVADEQLYDRELDQFPPEMRWREWILLVEAVIFASAEPVSRETLARVVGEDCSIDLLIDALVEALLDRPYELVSVAGGLAASHPAAVGGDHPGLVGADAGRGGVGIRGDGANGGGIFPARHPRRTE
jgi:hypothetical protein